MFDISAILYAWYTTLGLPSPRRCCMEDDLIMGQTTESHDSEVIVTLA